MELKLRYFLVFNKPFLLLKEIREKLQYYLRQIFSNYHGLKTSNYYSSALTLPPSTYTLQ